YYGLGTLDEAIGEYKKAIELYPNYAEAHYGLGLVYRNQGNKSQNEKDKINT
ncbi:MAG: tetratricopeptide repeat protein, partial [Deltaproteobacteria bacterium]|nr:tetratricopeptide repeat protein [Deltaproteobacteria bacterium]